MVDVLLVDDEVNFLKDLAEGLRLQSKKFTVVTTSSAEKALEILRTVKIDVVLTDLIMPGIGGLEFVRQVCSTRPHLPVIVMSACARVTMEERISGLNLAGYLEKPLDLDEIADAILCAAQHGRTGGRHEAVHERKRHRTHD